ncbi:MAG: sigma-70 family RNA polymerase sigma factor [Deltaproteobacteria bacterium]|nr:sigma-70 family RNA polymerase sigma factor [Deltaproteobacteria bacterium]MBN2671773.1 sigma-70 family RNA polymerase sigma factor [Deltaproteobacteria bacterium]
MRTLLFGKTREYTNLELIGAIDAGHPDAALEFHRRYGQRISRLVWSLLGADSEHDDIVQTVFVNIIESIGNIRDPEKLSAWVDSVIFRVVRKELRQRKKRRRLSVVDVDIQNLSGAPSGSVSIATMRFYKVLDRMNAQDRMVFILRYLERHSWEQIAKVSGLSVSTVKRRVQRAKSAFERLAEKDLLLMLNLGGHRNAV